MLKVSPLQHAQRRPPLKPLHSLLHRFLVAKEGAGRSPRTLTWYSTQLEPFVVYAEAQESHDLPTLIDGWLAQRRAAGVKPSTVAAAYRALSAWLNWCVRRRLLDVNPVADIDRPTVPKERRRFVTPEEARAVLDAITGGEWTDARDRLIVCLLYYSGLRAAELLALRVEDIDRSGGTVFVRQGKGMKARLVPVHGEVPSVLVRYLYERPPQVAADLFLSNNGAGGVRGPLTHDGLRQLLARRCAAAGVVYLHPHAWRHGFAMWALNAGVQLSGVSALLGHGDTRLTQQVYAHWQLGALKTQYSEALSRLGHDK